MSARPQQRRRGVREGSSPSRTRLVPEPLLPRRSLGATSGAALTAAPPSCFEESCRGRGPDKWGLKLERLGLLKKSCCRAVSQSDGSSSRGATRVPLPERCQPQRWPGHRLSAGLGAAVAARGFTPPRQPRGAGLSLCFGSIRQRTAAFLRRLPRRRENSHGNEPAPMGSLRR